MAASFRDFLIRTYMRDTYSREIFINGNTHNNSDNNNALSHILTVDISKNIIEVPCFALDQVFYALQANEQLKDLPDFNIINKVSIPVYNSNYYRSSTYKSITPIIKGFLYDAWQDNGLRELKTTTDTYIGGKGSIFYSNLEPMMLFYLILKKQDNRYIPIKQLIKLNSKIMFMYDALSKNIRSSFLLKCFEEGHSINTNDSYLRRGNPHRPLEIYRDKCTCIDTSKVLDYNFMVVIEDMSNFYDKVLVDTNQENINNFLKDNLTNILQEISPKLINVY